MTINLHVISLIDMLMKIKMNPSYKHAYKNNIKLF